MIYCRIKKFTGNRGSTLVTVIVAIAFVTILTAIILGTSAMNVRMKSIDRIAKDKFYYAERYLNDVYTGIGQEAAVIAGEEYEKAFKTLAEGAESEYKEKFLEETRKKLKLPAWNPLPHSMTDAAGVLDGYIVGVGGISHIVKIKDYNYETYAGANATPSTADRIRLVGVQVTSKDDKDFQAVITTDILIETPTMDFLGENVDVTDYCMIANRGLYIKGKATIKGNIYAGLHKEDSIKVLDYSGETPTPVTLKDSDYGEERVFGGINIKGKEGTGSEVKINGNYIVSKGDINLSGFKPKLTIGSGESGEANLYFDTLRTCQDNTEGNKKTIELNGNIFALNDLELNADNSNVKIKGNYYGYNDKTLPAGTKDSNMRSFSRDPDNADDKGYDDADSSAIIINGSGSTLDMKEIRTLVLMGRAYVDFSKGEKGGSSLETDVSKRTKVAPTAEAVALKTNQQMYLVPTDLLEGPNPVLSEDYDPEKGFVLAETTDFEGNKKTKFSEWFGHYFVDETKPFKTYMITLDDEEETKVYYAYLNFATKNSEGKPVLWLKDETQPMGYRDVTGDSSYAPLGTLKSVSSMEAFFDIVMSSKEKHDKIVSDAYNDAIEDGKSDVEAKAYAKTVANAYEDSMAAPSPYRVYERILRSMGYEYFNLRDCLIGDAANSAIVYSQNAIVNYATEKEFEKDEWGNIKKDAEDNPIVAKDAEGNAIVKKDDEGYPIFDSKILKNNTGMERYAAYPQNLFHRYQWLTTYLNAHQDLPLQEDPNNPSVPKYLDYKNKYSPYISTVNSEWKGDGNGYKDPPSDPENDPDDAAPLSHFIALDRIIKGTDTTGNVTDAVNRGLSRAGYGDCIVKKGDITIGNGGIKTVGETFKGVAIADGNITVRAGMTVNGLLMATGVIVVEDGAEITYDKGLIQARIEKEMANVRTFPESEPSPTPDPLPPGLKSYYLINYLAQNRKTGEPTPDINIMYKPVEGSKKTIDRIDADYHSFMFYENWQKGS